MSLTQSTQESTTNVEMTKRLEKKTLKKPHENKKNLCEDFSLPRLQIQMLLLKLVLLLDGGTDNNFKDKIL